MVTAAAALPGKWRIRCYIHFNSQETVDDIRQRVAVAGSWKLAAEAWSAAGTAQPKVLIPPAAP